MDMRSASYDSESDELLCFLIWSEWSEFPYSMEAMSLEALHENWKVPLLQFASGQESIAG